MRLMKIEITNFRGFSGFTLDVAGSSVFVISENGVGKSTLLLSIAKALGKERSPLTRADFTDSTQPLEIVATLGDFDLTEQGCFPGLLNFAGKPTLRVGVRAEWDDAERDVTTVLGFPDTAWQKKVTREQREAFPMVWVPSWREPQRALALGSSNSLLSARLHELNLTTETAKALSDIQAACDGFSTTPALAALLKAGRDELARLVPGVPATALRIGPGSASEQDLLHQFELLMAQPGPELPMARQSSGLVQLALFAFVLERLTTAPRSMVLVDEPELSLHPQAQRALTRLLLSHPGQAIVATHSSNVLDRVDPRTIVRLVRAAGVQPVRAATMTKADADRLRRFASSTSAEGFFARKVVVVEGYSDRLAFIELAGRLGRDLDAEGLSVISLEGGTAFAAHLALFGPSGLQLSMSGLCDVDKEKNWTAALKAAGAAIASRADLNSLGYFVCDQDLEDELVRSLGVANTEAVITAEGESAALHKFRAQPPMTAIPPLQVLRLFVQKDKVKWAPLLVGALDLATFKGALRDVVQSA